LWLAAAAVVPALADALKDPDSGVRPSGENALARIRPNEEEIRFKQLKVRYSRVAPDFTALERMAAVHPTRRFNGVVSNDAFGA